MKGVVSRLLGGDQEKNLNVRVPEELHHRVDVHCAINKTTIKQFVIEAVLEKLEKEEPETPQPS